MLWHPTPTELHRGFKGSMGSCASLKFRYYVLPLMSTNVRVLYSLEVLSTGPNVNAAPDGRRSQGDQIKCTNSGRNTDSRVSANKPLDAFA